MGSSFLVAIFIASPNCWPQDPGYPDCPWELANSSAGAIDAGRLIEAALLSGLLLMPLDRLLAAMFKHVRPPLASSFSTPKVAGQAWVLPDRFIGVGGKFAHIDNLITAQAHARGYLYRKGQYKETLKAQSQERPPPPEHIPDKDQLRLYPAPAPRHPKELYQTMAKLHQEIGPDMGDPQLIEALWQRRVPVPPVGRLNPATIVENSRPFHFQFERPGAGLGALPNSVGGVSAWELEPSLLLSNIRSNFVRQPTPLMLEQGSAATSSPSTPPEDSAVVDTDALNVQSSDSKPGTRQLAAQRAQLGVVERPPIPVGSQPTRLRSFRQGNAFEVRALEEERSQRQLPSIITVQSHFRGNIMRKQWRIELGVRRSRQVLPAGQIWPIFKFSGQPIRESAGRQPGSARSMSKYAPARPPVERFRRRQRIRARQAAPRMSDQIYGPWFLWVSYACCFVWCMMTGLQTAVVGRHFGPAMALEWVVGVLVATLWGATICESLKVVCYISLKVLMSHVEHHVQELKRHIK
jgi:hypothetical protein